MQFNTKRTYVQAIFSIKQIKKLRKSVRNSGNFLFHGSIWLEDGIYSLFVVSATSKDSTDSGSKSLETIGPAENRPDIPQVEKNG